MPKRPVQTGPWSQPKMSRPGPMLYDFGQDQDHGLVLNQSSPRSFIGPRTGPSNTTDERKRIQEWLKDDAIAKDVICH